MHPLHYFLPDTVITKFRVACTPFPQQSASYTYTFSHIVGYYYHVKKKAKVDVVPPYVASLIKHMKRILTLAGGSFQPARSCTATSYYTNRNLPQFGRA